MNGWRMDPTAYVLYVCGSTCSSYSDQPVAPDEMIGYYPFDYLKISKRNFKIHFIFLIFHRDFQKQKWNINLQKHKYELVNNFKILQKDFDSNGITRHIEVQKLVKAKYQDNPSPISSQNPYSITPLQPHFNLRFALIPSTIKSRELKAYFVVV